MPLAARTSGGISRECTVAVVGQRCKGGDSSKTMPYKRGTEPCVKEVGKLIYETLIEPGLTYHLPSLRPEHPAG